MQCLRRLRLLWIMKTSGLDSYLVPDLDAFEREGTARKSMVPATNSGTGRNINMRISMIEIVRDGRAEVGKQEVISGFIHSHSRDSRVIAKMISCN